MHCDEGSTADQRTGAGQAGTGRNCAITQDVKATCTTQTEMLQNSTVTTEKVVVPTWIRFVNIKAISCQFYLPDNKYNTKCIRCWEFKLSYFTSALNYVQYFHSET